jgi:hypothetical protein
MLKVSAIRVAVGLSDAAATNPSPCAGADCSRTMVDDRVQCIRRMISKNASDMWSKIFAPDQRSQVATRISVTIGLGL